MSTEENTITLPSSLANNYASAQDLPDIKFKKTSQLQLAWQDIKASCLEWRIWIMLAYQDIKLRYRRSVLGPFWITLSMAITVYSMGFLYAKLFHIELAEYFPFLVGGMLAWSLISTIILETVDGLIASESQIKQIKLSYLLYIHRIVARNFLIFFHNAVVIIPVIIMFHEVIKVNFITLLLIPGLIITYFNGLIYGTLLAMLGARYRDISQVIKSLVQVIFFITPVMWKPGVISERSYWIVDLNPFYGFIEMIREPMLGQMPTLKNLLSVFIVTMIGILLTSKVFVRYRSRIVYWL